MSEPETIIPDEARAEIEAMRGNSDHPLNIDGHFKKPQALDRLQTLLDAIDDTPAESRDANGVQTTADLEKIMEPALEPVGSPEDFSFDSFDRPEGSDWDVEQEGAFREIFFNAGLSQPEADQLNAIASSGVPVDAARTEAILQSRYRGNEEAMSADIAIARAFVQKVGGQPLADYLNETGLGDHIAYFDLALRRGKQMGIR